MSTERCQKDGKLILFALDEFIKWVNQCEYLIAHNFAFDYPVVGAEMIRAKMRANKKLKGICTMESSTNFCELPGKYSGKYKWPKLSELYLKLFNQELVDAHDALGDVKSTAACFFELLKIGVIKL